MNIFSFKNKLSNAKRSAALSLVAGVLGVHVAQAQTYTFTTAGNTGSVGPTQGQIGTAYGSTNLNNSVTVTGGIQSFTVPLTGSYLIDLRGASGGTPANYPANLGGLGARMSGEFSLNQGDVLKILVGQVGGNGTGGSGGGGGTFVERNGVLLIAAGGGGGATSDNSAAHATTLTAGTNDFPGGTIPGGVNGAGGQVCNGAGANHGGGGGGYVGDGGTSTQNNPGGGGHSFLNGGVGGAGGTAGAWGGFGGGGGTTQTTVGGGGGGGYSGGAGGQQVNYCTPGIGRSGGGGGGSYNSGVNQANASGVNFGDGSAILKYLCNVTVTSAVNPICYGKTTTLSTNASGAIMWSPGGSSSSNITVMPTTSTSYTVTGAGAGTAVCTGTAIITVSVLPLPSVSAILYPPIVCAGGTATLTAFGGVNYALNGVPGASLQVVTPAATADYTVSGFNAAGCENITVINVPVSTNSLGITSNTTICVGNSINLSASGAVTYTWSNGVPLQSIFVTPSVNTVYSVNGTDGYNCQLTNSVSVTVNSLPNVVASSDKETVCRGEAITLTANGADSYTWTSQSHGTFTGASVPVTLQVELPHVFTVTGKGTNGCVKTATVGVTADRCAGIAEQASATGLSVSPNPSAGLFRIETAAEGSSLQVLDATGRLIVTQELNSTTAVIDLRGFADGIYHARIVNKGSFQAFKLVKSSN